MKINLNGKNVEVTVVKNPQNKFEYDYYIGNSQIGELNTNIMKYGNIIMREDSYIIAALQKLGVMEQEKSEKQNTLENELSAQIKDKIDGLDREDIESAARETSEINKYIDELGIERSHIRDVRIIELDGENNNKENEKQNENKRNLESKKTERENSRKGQEQQKNAESTTKNTNILQEIELNERANDMHDIRKWLGGKIPKDITKVGVIYSDEMNKMKDENGKSYDRNSTRYSLVAISKDGRVEPLQKYIPELQQRSASGDNPVPEKYQVRDDGTVEKDSILSEYEIGNKVIQLDNKEMGRVEMNIGEEARDSTETMGGQVRDSNTPEVPGTPQRAVIGRVYRKNGEDTVKENLKEIKLHFEEHDDCTKATEKDIDGDPSTKSEHVMAMQDAYIKVCAREILDKNPELGETYNQNDIENKLKEKVNKEYLSKEELENSLDDIAKDLEKQAENEKVPGKDDRIA